MRVYGVLRMHVYVITGSSRIAYQGSLADAVREDLAQLPVGEPAVFVTGGQVGVDVVSLDALLGRYAASTHHVWLPAKKYADAQVQATVAEHGTQVRAAGGRILLHECLPGTTYPYRNLCMLQTAWHLRQQGYTVQVRAYPLHPEDDGRSKYSGTWKCVRQASQARLPIYLVPFYTAPA